ncbi:iron transporter FeoA [Desulfuromonas versatilis]|uniref:Iron transporter FeoA n=1 Tax=Desulfuromonas versatilis TaxID=2802975 RepID=A0ABN6E067_9BACT|nr:FeoA family protein [Desulfuromonas versatilis]BCR05710.1 iron transporter FeoA [Desulfuromonas versatilis]
MQIMMPLGLLSPGDQGEIVEIRFAQNAQRCAGSGEQGKSEVRVEDMGLRIGKSVEMLNNGSGPILLRVDESRIALARGLAMKIMVRRQG